MQLLQIDLGNSVNTSSLHEARSVINQYFQLDDFPSECGWSCILCADIVVYFEGFRQPLSENASALANFYEGSMSLIKNNLRWILINGEGRFRRITKKGFDLVPYWMSTAESIKGIKGVNMQGGPEESGRTDESFSFHRSVQAHVRLTLPVEYMLEDPIRFAELAKTLVGDLKFCSGYAGFSLNMALDGVGKDRSEGGHIHMLSRRFDGLDIGIPWNWDTYAIHGLKTINWLTFVGDGLAARMGGRESLRSSLPSDIPFSDMTHGLMIQAGPHPVLGDVNRQEDLREYYKVGRAPRKLAFPIPIVSDYYRTEDEFPDRIGGDANTERWCRRFFKG